MNWSIYIVLSYLLNRMNYHHRQYRKWFQQYQSGIVRHVHSATTPSGRPFGILEKCYWMRLWRLGTNTLHILRTTGFCFVRFVVQPHIYSFQCSDMLILPQTHVCVKAIHPTSDFIRRGFLARCF